MFFTRESKPTFIGCLSVKYYAPSRRNGTDIQQHELMQKAELNEKSKKHRYIHTYTNEKINVFKVG